MEKAPDTKTVNVSTTTDIRQDERPSVCGRRICRNKKRKEKTLLLGEKRQKTRGIRFRPSPIFSFRGPRQQSQQQSLQMDATAK